MDTIEQDYELLSQYVDRELSVAAARQLEQRLAMEPSLQAKLTRLQALQAQLQSAYGGANAEMVPERITSLLYDTPTQIVPLPHKRAMNMNWGFALAASLVVAASATLVTQWNQPPAQPGFDTMLSQALENTPSRASGWETLADGRNLRPVLSFQSKAGNWCREYLLADGEDGWHGVACRGDSGWSTSALAALQLTTDTSAEYRPAGATDSVAIGNFVDNNAADIPLDASQEADIIARSWQ